MNGVKAMTRFLAGYLISNVQSALEYKSSLVSQALGMLVNNVMWVTFWSAYFGRFHIPGWSSREVVTLWAVVCASYGLGNTLCGNAVKLAGMICRGEVDFYLTLPKPVLPHVLVSRMHLVAPGDLVFGFCAFGLATKPDATQWALFTLCTMTGAVVLVSFCVLTGSLAFWLGNAEGISGQLYGTITNFATYPTVIFDGAARLLLYTLVPAGFISTVPVELLREASIGKLLELLAGATFFAVLSVTVFYAGLRRYGSGNLLLVRE